MNHDNDRIREFLNTPAWDAEGWTGKGVTVGCGEDYINSQFPDHPYLMVALREEFAPDANVMYLPAEGYENETFMTDSIVKMIEKQVAVWFYSVHGASEGYNMDGAFEKVKDFCVMFNAAGNSAESDYAHMINAKWVYGIGACILMADGTVVPEWDSSLSEHVDFCVPANVWINGMYNTGTSISDSVIAWLTARVQQMAKAKTGKYLSSEGVYRFWKDNTYDFYEPGKDTKTGWGYVKLPDPKTVDIFKYQTGGITMSEKPTIQPAADWAQTAWQFAYDLGICDGQRPKDPITRQEVITLLYRCGIIK